MNKIVLIAALLMFSAPVTAATTTDTTQLTTGQEFLDKCSIVNSSLTNDTARVQFCYGFIYGMSNMMATLSMQDLSTVYITKKFLTYLSEHKNELNERTDLLFLEAIKEYWPL